MKSMLALLLIVNLLTCPVRCLSCEANGVVGAECTPTACSCCSHSDEAPESEFPDPCGDPCDCQNCICEGAVIEADVALPDSAVQWVVWVQHAVPTIQTGDFLNETFSRRSRAPAGQFLCGRDVRIAHQSWLI